MPTAVRCGPVRLRAKRHAETATEPEKRSRAGAGLLLLLVCLWAPAVGAAPPARIVSTSPSITETLFALGLGDRVVGVSQYCRYPDEARRLPKVGTFLDPDVELIVRLRPELVIVHAGPSGAERRLQALRIPVLVVDRGTLSSIFTTIRSTAKAVDMSDRAEALITSLEARLARVREAVSRQAPKKVLLIVGRRPGTLTDLIAAGGGSYLNDLVTIAGGVNVLGRDTAVDYPRISVETIIRLAPEVIVDVDGMGDTAEERAARETATVALWAGQPLIAAQKSRVYAAVSDAFVIPGPRLAEVTETFARWFHGATP
jgi:iron complex transport system substrate-binding protein